MRCEAHNPACVGAVVGQEYFRTLTDLKQMMHHTQ
jgi:hypothetical protein